jgi:hypothetical protein
MNLLAAMMLKRPTHAKIVIRPSVRMLLRQMATTAATTTKTAVQVPWVETALRAIETLSKPEPVTKTQSCNCEALARGL